MNEHDMIQDKDFTWRPKTGEDIIRSEYTKVLLELKTFEDARYDAAKNGWMQEVKRLNKCIAWNKERLKNM